VLGGSQCAEEIGVSAVVSHFDAAAVVGGRWGRKHRSRQDIDPAAEYLHLLLEFSNAVKI